MAGMVSLINSYRKEAGKSTMGFLNPFLYASYASFVNDITSGNNLCTSSINVCCSEGYYAVDGWDPVTGLGSIDFPNFYTAAMSAASTHSPSRAPTRAPTSLTRAPTTPPTKAPTKTPTLAPTRVPTLAPSQVPTKPPTFSPTKTPTQTPSQVPTKPPTQSPTKAPTRGPTFAPSKTPTAIPTKAPTRVPTVAPTRAPTQSPSYSRTPTVAPSKAPTIAPAVAAVHIMEDSAINGARVLNAETGTLGGSTMTAPTVSMGPAAITMLSVAALVFAMVGAGVYYMNKKDVVPTNNVVTL